jgi:3-hydroxyisobutyrate dehydrogenase
MRVWIIDHGMIGGGIAQCFAWHGRALSVYDIRPDAAQTLAGVPAVLESPGAVALRSDIVIIAVVSAEQVASVLRGPNGILASAAPGSVVLIVSTIAVSAFLQFAAEADHHGVHLIYAGVRVATRQRRVVSSRWL